MNKAPEAVGRPSPLPSPRAARARPSTSTHTSTSTHAEGFSSPLVRDLLLSSVPAILNGSSAENVSYEEVEQALTRRFGAAVVKVRARGGSRGGRE